MKKSTLENLRNYLNGDETVDLSVLRDEVNEEYDRLTAKARTNKYAYAVAKDVAVSVLSDTPMTAKEVFAATDKWPDGFSANKVQYGLNNYWQDVADRHDNGKNPYTYTAHK